MATGLARQGNVLLARQGSVLQTMSPPYLHQLAHTHVREAGWDLLEGKHHGVASAMLKRRGRKARWAWCTCETLLGRFPCNLAILSRAWS